MEWDSLPSLTLGRGRDRQTIPMVSGSDTMENAILKSLIPAPLSSPLLALSNGILSEVCILYRSWGVSLVNNRTVNILFPQVPEVVYRFLSCCRSRLVAP